MSLKNDLSPFYTLKEEIASHLERIENAIPRAQDSHGRAELRAQSKAYRTIHAQLQTAINQQERKGDLL